MKTVIIFVALLGVFACAQETIEDCNDNPFKEEDAFEPIDAQDLQISQMPESIDWTHLHAVSPVGDAGKYAYSWAFAVAGVVESRHYIAHKNLTILSKQQLVDCCQIRCAKHRLKYALSCIKKMGGIDTEATYPYLGTKEQCHFNKTNIGARIKLNFEPRKETEKVLAMYVAQGPVAADISYNAIQSYTSGVLSKVDCRKSKGPYSVLIVGYGTSSEGDYWILKTSKGSKWGEGGFMRLARNQNNLCGIGNSVYYPQVL